MCGFCKHHTPGLHSYECREGQTLSSEKLKIVFKIDFEVKPRGADSLDRRLAANPGEELGSGPWGRDTQKIAFGESKPMLGCNEGQALSREVDHGARLSNNPEGEGGCRPESDFRLDQGGEREEFTKAIKER